MERSNIKALCDCYDFLSYLMDRINSNIHPSYEVIKADLGYKSEHRISNYIDFLRVNLSIPIETLNIPASEGGGVWINKRKLEESLKVISVEEFRLLTSLIDVCRNDEEKLKLIAYINKFCNYGSHIY